MPDTIVAEAPGADTSDAVSDGSSVLRNRDFLLLWLAQVFSQIAQNALILGVLVLVQRLTKSPTHLSIAAFALLLPSVLFSMLAGVVVDHLDKRSVLAAANFLRAAAAVGYLLLDESLLLIYVVSFAFSTIGQFFSPAEAAAIPMLVPKRQLIAANSLFNLTLSAAQLLGLVVVAPLLIKVVGMMGFFVALAVLFLLAGLFVFYLPTDDRAAHGLSARQSERLVRDVWAELREGWHILRSDALASLALLYLTLMAALIPLLAVLGPAFAVGVIRVNAEDVVYLFAPAGAAMVLATAMVGKLVERAGKLRLMLGSLLVLGLTMVLLAGAKTGGMYLLYNILGRVVDTRRVVFELIPIVMILSFILGLAFVCVSIPAQTLLQERCPAQFRGRIFGVQFTLSGAGSLLPLLGAGGFADVFGVNKTIFLIGVVLLVIGAVLLERLRRYESRVRGLAENGVGRVL